MDDKNILGRLQVLVGKMLAWKSIVWMIVTGMIITQTIQVEGYIYLAFTVAILGIRGLEKWMNGKK